MSNKNVWYALRRTLPPFSFEENLEELIKCLPQYRVDEVIVKVDAEEFFHGQPQMEWVKDYQKNLLRIKEKMGTLGILYSINPWITTGHNDRGRDSRKTHPGLQTSVGHDGTQATCVACSLCPVWRKNTERIWTLYAETKPHVIWVEDDIRAYGHQPTHFACFCPLHVRRFSERIGRDVSREELVEAILRPGEPHPWRREYLDMQAEIMIETVAFLAGVVHSISPETSLGLMSSNPRGHCREGRRWKKFATALADGRSLYSRPSLGSYHEDSLRGLYYAQDSIKITRFCMPKNTTEITEVENFPFSRYSKSVVFTFLQMAVSIAYGARGVTLNIFDHCGSPMKKEVALGNMLGGKKQYLNALAEKTQIHGEYKGVRILHHEKAGYNNRLKKGDTYIKLGSDDLLTYEMLESHGIPTTYADSDVIAVSGQLIRSFSDVEVREMLSKGILLDAVAVKVLYERGFGREIGIEEINEPELLNNLGVFSAEEFFNEKFGGADKKFLSLTLPDLPRTCRFGILNPVKDAKIISRIVDPDAKRHYVCMYAYENNLGGRVAVYSYEMATSYGVAFCNPNRMQQLQNIVRWLSYGRHPVLVRGDGVYPLAFRKDTEKETILGFFNLTLDPWTYVEFELSDQHRVAYMETLSSTGKWGTDSSLTAETQDASIFIRAHKSIAYDEPFFVLVRWE